VLENSLLQTLKSVNKGVPLPMQDEELTARDPAAGPPGEAELVPQDEGDIVFMEINETVAQEETKTTCMKVVLAILRRAKELDLANGRFNHTHTPELVMNDLKAALKAGKDPWKVLRDDHWAMATCIEDFASSTEVDDLDPSLVLTSHWLELINGLQDTPEFSNSSDVIEGDMKVSNSDQAELIQALSEQGARWTINKWQTLEESHIASVNIPQAASEKQSRMLWHTTRTWSLAFVLYK